MVTCKLFEKLPPFGKTERTGGVPFVRSESLTLSTTGSTIWPPFGVVSEKVILIELTPGGTLNPTDSGRKSNAPFLRVELDTALNDLEANVVEPEEIVTIKDAVLSGMPSASA